MAPGDWQIFRPERFTKDLQAADGDGDLAVLKFMLTINFPSCTVILTEALCMIELSVFRALTDAYARTS